jgi:hypothetical protein
MKEIEQLGGKATIPTHADISMEDIDPLYADEEDDEEEDLEVESTPNDDDERLENELELYDERLVVDEAFSVEGYSSDEDSSDDNSSDEDFSDDDEEK